MTNLKEVRDQLENVTGKELNSDEVTLVAKAEGRIQQARINASSCKSCMKVYDGQ